MLWEKKKAPVVEAGYPKLIVAIKRTNGQTYFVGNVPYTAGEDYPMTLPYESLWGINDLIVEKFPTSYTRANVGDILTAYYVNNSTELWGFPSSAHLVTDAVWGVSKVIHLTSYKPNSLYHTYTTSPSAKLVELSSYSGETTSISSHFRQIRLSIFFKHSSRFRNNEAFGI